MCRTMVGVRLWSLHPSQLDRAALIACWREALLAQAVLAGRTRGYTRHPQLDRFRASGEPIDTIGRYLTALADEAHARGYRFDRNRIDAQGEASGQLAVASGQLDFEWAHLGAKLAVRAPADARRWLASSPRSHPLFVVVEGDVEAWERG